MRETQSYRYQTLTDDECRNIDRLYPGDQLDRRIKATKRCLGGPAGPTLVLTQRLHNLLRARELRNPEGGEGRG